MNFFDVYTTLALNPTAAEPLAAICRFVACENAIEPLKRGLWRHPSRIDSPGAFPFDEATGRIYDSLWKAASAENYSRLERFGRWLMKTVCPPADDEGMAAYHRRPGAPPDAPAPPPRPPPARERPAPPDAPEWTVDDDGDDREIRVPSPALAPGDEVTRRSTKKAD
jgi:hypothetical protein